MPKSMYGKSVKKAAVKGLAKRAVRKSAVKGAVKGAAKKATAMTYKSVGAKVKGKGMAKRSARAK